MIYCSNKYEIFSDNHSRTQLTYPPLFDLSAMNAYSLRRIRSKLLTLDEETSQSYLLTDLVPFYDFSLKRKIETSLGKYKTIDRYIFAMNLHRDLRSLGDLSIPLQVKLRIEWINRLLDRYYGYF